MPASLRDGEAGDGPPWAELLRVCSIRCTLAEDVEAALQRRTERLAALVERSPMIALADRWSRDREVLSCEDVAGLLWCLSRDPRPHLEKLASRLAGDLCIRVMQLGRARPTSADAPFTRPAEPDDRARAVV